jgi:restriction-modification system family protein
MERYHGVRRHKEVAFIARSLVECGIEIITAADPTVAPFCFRVRTPQGDELDLICYAFHANKYRQGNRPQDEHRFQVKYGSDFTRYHELYISQDPNCVTLMFGVHLEAQMFIAVDPAMHCTTWFSKSVEFKEQNLLQARRSGWHGWERERSEGGRRKEPRPLLNLQTEVVLGFRPEYFLQYIQLERAARGFAPGERLFWIDQLAPRLADRVAEFSRHELEDALGLSKDEILDLASGAFRLMVAMRGAAAEKHLETHLESVSALDEVKRIDEDGRPDFEVRCGRKKILVECKNVLRRSKPEQPKVDFQKTRASKNDPCSRYYRPEDFHILAACLHPVTATWDFRFCDVRVLDPHKTCPGRLSQKVLVTGQHWQPSVADVVQRIVG